MFTNVLNGVTATVRNWRLVVLIWAWYGILAGVTVMPAVTWWRGTFNHAIEAASLLGGFNFGILADLTKYDSVGAFGLLTGTLAGAMALALVSSCFIMGGMITVVADTDSSRNMMREFFGGAGRYFWRFVRLLIIGAVCILVSGVVIAMALAAVNSAISDNVSESGSFVLLIVNVAVLAIGCGLFILALDYARIQVVVDDARGMFKVFVRSVGFVARHAITAFGMAITIVVVLAVVMLAYLAYETKAPVASTWALIFLLSAIQQVVIAMRVGLRVSLVTAEFRYAQSFAVAREARAVPVTAEAIPPARSEDGAERPAAQ